MIDFEEVLSSVVDLINEVAEFQLSYFRAMPEGLVTDKALRETVSFVDIESEKRLLEGLSSLVDGAGFFGEESGKQGSQELTWVIDPLDGTTNFLSGLDHFSISVALVEDHIPILGVICKPYSGDLFTAIKGRGVYFNGVKSKLAGANANPKIEEALFMTGFPYRSPQVAESFFKTAAEVLKLGRGIRRSGSAALDLAYLSMGWLQGFWETDLQPYDVAAGILLLEENKVLMTNGGGEVFDMFSDDLIVAAPASIHPKFLQVIREGYSLD